jgi:hypothetical protein
MAVPRISSSDMTQCIWVGTYQIMEEPIYHITGYHKPNDGISIIIPMWTYFADTWCIQLQRSLKVEDSLEKLVHTYLPKYLTLSPEGSTCMFV